MRLHRQGSGRVAARPPRHNPPCRQVGAPCGAERQAPRDGVFGDRDTSLRCRSSSEAFGFRNNTEPTTFLLLAGFLGTETGEALTISRLRATSSGATQVARPLMQTAPR